MGDTLVQNLITYGDKKTAAFAAAAKELTRLEKVANDDGPDAAMIEDIDAARLARADARGQAYGIAIAIVVATTPTFKHPDEVAAWLKSRFLAKHKGEPLPPLPDVVATERARTTAPAKKASPKKAATPPPADPEPEPAEVGKARVEADVTSYTGSPAEGAAAAEALDETVVAPSNPTRPNWLGDPDDPNTPGAVRAGDPGNTARVNEALARARARTEAKRAEEAAAKATAE